MATLPAITLNSSARQSEVWSMFWELSELLNGRLTSDNIAFGNPKDFSSSSKNLDPGKVHFIPAYGGHDHSMGGGRALTHGSISKRNFDVNSLNITWVDYWNDALGGDESARYVLIHGYVTMDGSARADTGAAYVDGEFRWVYVQSKLDGIDPNTQGSNEAKADLQRTGDLDSNNWDGILSNVEIMAVLATPEIKSSADYAQIPSMWTAYPMPDSAGGVTNYWGIVASGQITGNWTANVVVFGKVTGGAVSEGSIGAFSEGFDEGFS